MFNLHEFLNIENINLELVSNTKSDIIKEMASMLKNDVDDFDQFYSDILKREEAGSTAMEYGLAIPHVRTKHIKNFKIALGIKKEGISCDSLDGKDTKIFFLIATNDKYNDYHLDALVKIMKIITSEMIVDVLVNSKSKEGLIELIKKLEQV